MFLVADTIRDTYRALKKVDNVRYKDSNGGCD